MANDIHVVIHKNDLARLARAADGAVNNALAAAAEAGAAHAKTLIQSSPATGNTYRRGRKTHTSASPGNAPRIDTGTLINSITAQRQGNRAYRIYTAQVDYAHYLEFGSERWAGGIKFPFMTPTAQYVEGILPGLFDHFLE